MATEQLRSIHSLLSTNETEATKLLPILRTATLQLIELTMTASYNDFTLDTTGMLFDVLCNLFITSLLPSKDNSNEDSVTTLMCRLVENEITHVKQTFHEATLDMLISDLLHPIPHVTAPTPLVQLYHQWLYLTASYYRLSLNTLNWILSKRISGESSQFRLKLTQSIAYSEQKFQKALTFPIETSRQRVELFPTVLFNHYEHFGIGLGRARLPTLIEHVPVLALERRVQYQDNEMFTTVFKL